MQRCMGWLRRRPGSWCHWDGPLVQLFYRSGTLLFPYTLMPYLATWDGDREPWTLIRFSRPCCLEQVLAASSCQSPTEETQRIWRRQVEKLLKVLTSSSHTNTSTMGNGGDPFCSLYSLPVYKQTPHGCSHSYVSSLDQFIKPRIFSHVEKREA